mmetsp:Transcript_13940/g.21097  ORF Transcript_13940/g.21097 Transcript_13940/m.21097 type:complete len:603 (+) Transcript_13940:47-1855(+)
MKKRICLLFLFFFFLSITFLLSKKSRVEEKHVLQGHQRKLLGGGAAKKDNMGSFFDVNKYDAMSSEEKEEWCASITNNTVYTIGLKLHCSGNAEIALIAILVAVFMTIFIEIVTHYLQNRIHSELTRELIEKVYRELMMIGLISFGVLTLESIEFFEVINRAFFDTSTTSAVSHKQVIIFEFVHIGIFILSIYYIITSALLYFIIRYVCKIWVYFERAYSNEDQQRVVNQLYSFRDRHWSKRFLNPILNMKALKNYVLLSYWRIRRRFVAEHRAEVPENFPFYQYLKQRARKFLVEICEIGMSTWVSLFLGTGCMFVVYHFYRDLSRYSLFLIISVYCVLSILLLLFLIFFILYPYNKYNTEAVSQALKSHEESLLDDASISELDQEDMNYYFPFHSPQFTFYLMQVTLFLQSFFLSLGSINLFYSIIYSNIFSSYLFLRILLVCFLVVFPLITVLMYSIIIPPFIILSSVGSLKSNTLIRETIHWMHKNPNGKVKKKRNHKLNKHHLPYFEDSDRDLRIRNSLRERIQHTLYVAEESEEIVFQSELPSTDSNYAHMGVEPKKTKMEEDSLLYELQQPHMLSFFTSAEARDEAIAILKTLKH